MFFENTNKLWRLLPISLCRLYMVQGLWSVDTNVPSSLSTYKTLSFHFFIYNIILLHHAVLPYNGIQLVPKISFKGQFPSRFQPTLSYIKNKCSRKRQTLVGRWRATQAVPGKMIFSYFPGYLLIFLNYSHIIPFSPDFLHFPQFFFFRFPPNFAPFPSDFHLFNPICPLANFLHR